MTDSEIYQYCKNLEDKIPRKNTSDAEEKEFPSIDEYLNGENGYVETQDVNSMFFEWCTKEGVVMPKL